MYDEWMYTNDFQQEAPAQTLAPPKHRKRAKSILQSVAIDSKNYSSQVKAKRSIPEEADVPRRRAHSVSKLVHPPISEPPKVYPFTRTDMKYFDNFYAEPEVGITGIDTANDADFIIFRDTANLHLFSCNKLLKQSDIVLDYINNLTKGFDNVHKETHSLQETCNGLLNEQARLTNLCDEIDKNLKVFENLDNITRQLNSPGTDLVIKKTFPTLLDQLDEGLIYVQKHKHFKSIEIYQQRFRHCMTRALSLVQVYIQTALKDLENEAHNTKVANAAAINVFLYAKFEAEADTIFNLTKEIAQRGESHEEYNELLLDCMRTYFATRYKLLAPQIYKNSEESAKDQTEIIQFTRLNLLFYKNLCKQEYKLFYKFFNTGEDTVVEWLGELCSFLYDTVRQRVIRETDINLLCELTSMLLDYKKEEDGDSSSVGSMPVETEQEDEEIDFFELFKPVLQDIQSRLLFRVQAFVEQEIVRHVPKEEDLYGLSHRRSHKRAKSTSSELQGTREFDPENLFKDWYPPMRKAVTLLSQIYQLISSTIFDDLAHRIVHECLGSLQAAHTLAVSRIGKLEADLFLIKHLLLLRQQIMEFDIEYIPAEVQFDFSGLAEVFELVKTEGVSLNTSHLLNLAKIGVPKVVNNMFDAKEELYAKLRNAVHDVTEEAVKSVIGSISTGTIDVEKVVEQTRKLREDASKEVPRLRKVMEGYIEDSRTVDILIDSVQDLVIQAYEKYYDQVVVEARKTGASLEGVMEVEGLVAWFGEVNGRLRLEREGEDEI